MDVYCQSHDQTESPPAFVFGNPIKYMVGEKMIQSLYGTCPKCQHVISIIFSDEDMEQEEEIEID